MLDRSSVARAVSKEAFTPTLFDAAQSEVLRLIRDNAMSRFAASEGYDFCRKLVRLIPVPSSSSSSGNGARRGSERKKAQANGANGDPMSAHHPESVMSDSGDIALDSILSLGRGGARSEYESSAISLPPRMQISPVAAAGAAGAGLASPHPMRREGSQRSSKSAQKYQAASGRSESPAAAAKDAAAVANAGKRAVLPIIAAIQQDELGSGVDSPKSAVSSTRDAAATTYFLPQNQRGHKSFTSSEDDDSSPTGGGVGPALPQGDSRTTTTSGSTAPELSIRVQL